MRRLATLALAASAAWNSSVLCATPAPEEGKVVGLAFVGRMVSDLDRSVAFYKTLGFGQDPAANPAWRRDEVIEKLYGIAHVETRMAKMYVVNSSSGRHFAVYLRELRGLPRTNQSDHTAWDPGVSHFGLIVPDAQKTWSQLEAAGLLRARSWGGKLIAPPGQTKGMLAYLTDPDGLDIELIDQRPAAPAEDGRPGRPALLPGVNHVGLVVLDSDKARAFYGDLLGGKLLTTEAPWLKGDFYDSAVGGHGNILRFYNEVFADASAASTAHLNFELVEFQNRKKPVVPARIADAGVGYVGVEVQGLDAFLKKVKAAGGKTISSSGIVTMRSGTREIMVRDPDVGGFVELFEHPAKKVTEGP